MPKLVKDKAIVECERSFIAKDGTIADLTHKSNVVPLALWQTERATCLEKGINAVWLDSEQTADPLNDDLAHLSLIAIRFPSFMDGRGFSIGRILRERLGFKGEIRAFGNVIQDQMHFLMRCGFNAMDLRANTDLESALASLEDFTEHYQAAVVQPKPLFQRRA